ncbi:MAG: hypothetical protein LBI53_01520 [Candidatus Peribacteria bacterium]|jgi:hypothetical protein|nr:hypothetical protein [Candidatus Peribacteria bacterium]
MEKAYPLESTDANARTIGAVNSLTTGELDKYYEQLTNNKYQTKNTELTTRYTNSEGKNYDLQLKGNDIIENQNHLLYLLGKNINPTDDAKEKYAELLDKAVANAKKITTEKDFKELMRIISKENPKRTTYKEHL